MRRILFPYGKESLEYSFGDELIGVLESKINSYIPKETPDGLVSEAMANPVGSKRLGELARGKKNIVIIASDHTRPVPSKFIIPKMLVEIRETSPDAEITILIATGCHRETTVDELRDKFGDDIVNNEKIVVHDCDDTSHLVNIGTLPSGGECVINSIAVNADLLVSEGFIEPHFFAGFSGGRKSVLPGISARKTVLANHCSEFIASPFARTGVLDGNPIHRDMVWAARKAGLAYIVNVVLNEKKEIIYAVAGDMEEAHKKGTDFLINQCRQEPVLADIVITTNGGYPLDQNAYQSVKGMSAAEGTVREGGVIIMISKCGDGLGGDAFYHQIADEADIDKTMNLFLSRGRNDTVPDQWQSQVMVRILRKASVIYISELDDETVRAMHMTPAHSLGEALEEARKKLGKSNPEIVAVPDGISVII